MSQTKRKPRWYDVVQQGPHHGSSQRAQGQASNSNPSFNPRTLPNQSTNMGGRQGGQQQYQQHRQSQFQSPTNARVVVPHVPIITPNTNQMAAAAPYAAPPDIQPPAAPRKRDFVSEDLISKTLCCPVCFNVFTEPHRTDCGHVFCKNCIVPWVSVNSSCPLDRMFVSMDRIYPDYFAANVIGELYVFCPNKNNGCPWVEQLQSLDAHEKTCTFAYIPCVHGCGTMILRSDETHLQQICEFRPVACQCGFAFHQKDLEVHKQTCPEQVITCVYMCGEQFPRRMEESHTRLCLKAPVACPHAILGCKFEGEQQTLAAHLTTCHYEALKEVLYTMQKRITDMEQVIELLQGRSVQQILQSKQHT